MKLYVFFTYGVSLKVWDEVGILSREVKLYKELARHGVKTVFVTYGDKSDYKYCKEDEEIEVLPIYDVVRRRKNKIFRFLASFYLPYVFVNEVRDADVIKSKQIWGAWVPAIISRKLYVPYLLRTGYDYLDFQIKANKNKFVIYIYKKLIKKIYQYSSFNIVTTLADKSNLEKYYDVNKNIDILPNWVDTDLFKCKSMKKLENRVLFVGRLVEQKNLFTLIDAVSIASVGLDIVGNGPLKEDLLNYAASKRADIRMLGSVDNDKLPDVYSRYLIYVLPSKYEGNPKTLLEAMSCEMAIIASNAPGISNVITNEINGLLVYPDSDKISNAIIRLNNDRLLAKNIGNKAREYVIHNNSLTKYAELEFHIMENIIAKKNNSY